MTKCKMTPDITQRVNLRCKFIKETKDPLQQSEELKILLDILENEDVTKRIIDELKIAQAKEKEILAHTKSKAYSWLKGEFEYFKSISDSSQHCIDDFLNKAEEHLSGKIKEFDFTNKQLWEKLWEIYVRTCSRLVESGYSNLIDGRATIFIREQISWEPNPDVIIQKNNNIEELMPYLEEPLPYLMCLTPKPYLDTVIVPNCIQQLLEFKKIQEKSLSSKKLIVLFNTLSSISLLHSFKLLKPDFSKYNLAEYLGLKPSATSLELDERLIQFSNQCKIAHILQKPNDFLKMVIDLVECFWELMMDKMASIKLFKGPQLKSHYSRMAHDWYFTQMYKFVIDSTEKGLQPTQKEVITWANILKALPDYLQSSASNNLLEGVCKEIARVTAWSCPGGRPSKKKHSQQ